MNIVVKGNHVKENIALEKYAFKKSEKFYLHYPKIVKVEIELRSESSHKRKEDDFIADILIKVPGHTFKVSDHERDMYKAIDQSVARMVEVLRREKEKHQKKYSRNVKKWIVSKLGLNSPLQVFKKSIFRKN